MKKLGILAMVVAFTGNAVAQDAAYGLVPDNPQQVVKDYFEFVFVDPESTRYKTISEPKPVDWSNYWKGKGYQVCVTINTKNRSGGYVGWQTWAVVIRDGEARDHVGVTRMLVGGDRGCPEDQVID